MRMDFRVVATVLIGVLFAFGTRPHLANINRLDLDGFAVYFLMLVAVGLGAAVAVEFVAEALARRRR